MQGMLPELVGAQVAVLILLYSLAVLYVGMQRKHTGHGQVVWGYAQTCIRQGSVWDHAGVGQESDRGQLRVSQGSGRGQSGMMQGTGRSQAGVRQGSGKGQPRVSQGLGRGQCVMMQGSGRSRTGVRQGSTWVRQGPVWVCAGVRQGSCTGVMGRQHFMGSQMGHAEELQGCIRLCRAVAEVMPNRVTDH